MNIARLRILGMYNIPILRDEYSWARKYHGYNAPKNSKLAHNGPTVYPGTIWGDPDITLIHPDFRSNMIKLGKHSGLLLDVYFARKACGLSVRNIKKGGKREISRAVHDDRTGQST